VTLHFTEEETGDASTATLQVPVAFKPGDSLDQVHERAVAKAEDLCQLAAHHLEDNDVEALQRMSLGG
jgi:hypothetical protein